MATSAVEHVAFKPLASESPEALSTRLFRREMGHISRHSSIYFAGTIFALAAGYPFRIYLARVLGAEALGVYALGMTIVGFVGVFNDFGLSQAAVRFVAHYAATGQANVLRSFLRWGISLVLLTNLILGIAIWKMGPWVASHLYRTVAVSPYFLWFAWIMLFGALNGFLVQVLSGYRDVAGRTLITNFIGSPLTIILSVGLISAGWGLRGYLAAQVFGAMVMGILLLGTVRKLTPRFTKGTSARSLFIESEVVVFSMAALGLNFLEFLVAQADKILVGVYLHARDLGIYAMAGALIGFVPIVLTSVNQIFSPQIAHLHASGEIELLGRIYQTLTKWILGLTIPLAGVMIVFASPLMRIFGKDFEAGWPILVIGTIGQLVNCAVGSVGYLLLMSGNQSRLIKIQGYMAVATIAISFCLIPRWGLIGAAVASAISNVGTNLFCLREVQRRLGVSPYNRTYLRLIVPVVATTIILGVLHAGMAVLHIDWIIIIITALISGYVVFLAASLAFGLDGDDRIILSAIGSRVRQTFRWSEAGV